MTELELRAHKMASVGAIENLMSLNAYYRAANPESACPVQTGARAEQPDLEQRTEADMPVRCLVSPVIEISADGITAKALWYSPGFSMHHDYAEKSANVKWVWEKCAAQFAYENGTWRITDWNFHTDLTAEEPGVWTENGENPRMLEPFV